MQSQVNHHFMSITIQCRMSKNLRRRWRLATGIGNDLF